MALRMGALFKKLKSEAASSSPSATPKSVGGSGAAACPSSSPSLASSADGAAVAPKAAYALTVEEDTADREALVKLPILLDGSNKKLLPGLPTVHCIESALDDCSAAALEAFFRHPMQRERWVVLKGRSLQMYGGTVAPGGVLENQEPLPPPLQQLCDALVSIGLYDEQHKPNHALVNLYLPGQGIMPHTDGPAYYPRTTTISLGCTALMVFSERVTTPSSSDGTASSDVMREVPLQEVILRPNSAVVFEGEAYTRAMHSIQAVTREVVGGTGSTCVNADDDDDDDSSAAPVEESDAYVPCRCGRGHPSTPTFAAARQKRLRTGDVIERSCPRISITLRHVGGSKA